jgi:hypothetical protein
LTTRPHLACPAVTDTVNTMVSDADAAELADHLANLEQGADAHDDGA